MPARSFARPWRITSRDLVGSLRSVVVLGAGYTGEILIRQFLKRGVAVTATRRSWGTNPSAFDAVSRIEFDLANPSTWRSLPAADAAAWLFPAEPPEQVALFAHRHLREIPRWTVIGTTSSYHSPGEGEIVTEASPLDMSVARVQGEEKLRMLGANVLRAAGIYGPGRNPLDWLRGGRIAGEERTVNLIHVEDLAAAVIASLESAFEGEHFIVCDGRPRRWGSIASWAINRGYIRDVKYDASTTARSSRELSNAKLLELLKPPMSHADLFEELELLERERSIR